VPGRSRPLLRLLWCNVHQQPDEKPAQQEAGGMDLVRHCTAGEGRRGRGLLGYEQTCCGCVSSVLRLVADPCPGLRFGSCCDAFACCRPGRRGDSLTASQTCACVQGYGSCCGTSPSGCSKQG